MATSYIAYYNSNERKCAQTLFVPNYEENALIRNFSDITDIDLYTIDKTKEELIEELSKFNKKVKMTTDGDFYVVTVNGNSKSFYPVMHYDDRYSNLIDGLSYFAEDRNEKIKIKNATKSGRIDLNNNDYLWNYAKYMIRSILSKPESRILDVESIIPADLKQRMRDKYNRFYDMEMDRYLQYFRKTYTDFLKYYLNLRALTYSYIDFNKYRYYGEGKFNTRSRLNQLYRIYIKDLVPTNPVDMGSISEAYAFGEQGQLADFINIPRVTENTKAKTKTKKYPEQRHSKYPMYPKKR